MKKILPWALAAFFFVVGLLTVNNYGINWDEPARLLRGQAFLNYFLTGRQTFGLPARLSPIVIAPGEYVTRYDRLSEEGQTLALLPDIPRPQEEFATKVASLGKRVSFYQDDVWSRYFLTYSAFEAGHLPLPEILGSISNRFFWGRLGVFGDIESYHIPYLVISAVGVVVVGLFAFDLTGSWVAALTACLTLGLFPVFWAESHFNLKDPLVASFYAGAVWMFWRWVKENKIRWFVGFILCVVLSLAVKWNIVFFPFIAIPWLFSIRKTPEFRRWFNPSKLLVLACVACVACVAFLLLIWPASWGSPVRALSDVVRYYTYIGSGGINVQPAGFMLPLGVNAYPAVLFFAQTPEVILLLVGIGIWGIAAKRRKDLYLLLLWFFVPILRYSLPGMYSYGGWRQIMEILPAMAVISGVGMTLIPKYIKIIIIIMFILIMSSLIRLHPNENTYFNSLVGGIRGAQAKNLIDPFLTYGNIYKEGAQWLNVHAEKNARVAVLDGRTFALSPLYLRPDISVSPYFFSRFERKGEYIFVTPINNVNESPVFSYQYVRTFLRPVHEVSVNGVTILSIYKNDPAFLRPGFSRETPVAPVRKSFMRTPKYEYLELDLGKMYRVTRIVLKGVSPSCRPEAPFTSYSDVVQFSPLLSDTYALAERDYDANGLLTYYFPAVQSQTIKIYPNTSPSCFVSSTVSAVYALE